MDNAKAKWLAAVLGAAAVAVAPALLFTGAGTAHADPACDDGGSLQSSYYCSPLSGPHEQTPQDSGYTPVQPPFGYNNLPGCSGGVLPAIVGALNGQGCS